MLDLGTNTSKTHAHLSDLIKLSSDEVHGGGHDLVSKKTSILGPGGLESAGNEDGGGSGASTPPLWRPESPESRRRNYTALSPSSRTEAIARGQMELMEMVRNMPESCYELSLKDLVEVKRNQDRVLEGQGQNGNFTRRPQRQPRQQGHMVRSGSLDGNSGGFLLKMVFPVPWGARKKNKKKSGGLDVNNGNYGVNGGEVGCKEWWKGRGSLSGLARGESGPESSSLNSRSRKSSSNGSSSSSWSSNSNNSSRRHESDTDCWSFIRTTNKSRPLKC